MNKSKWLIWLLLTVSSVFNFAKAWSEKCFIITEVDSLLSHYIAIFCSNDFHDSMVILVDRQCDLNLKECVPGKFFCDSITKFNYLKANIYSIDSSDITTAIVLRVLTTTSNRKVFSPIDEIYPYMPNKCLKLGFYRRAKEYSYKDYRRFNDSIR